MLANLLHDVRYALHGFALRPMFAIVVVLTLAVGIGVNVAAFSLYDRIMLRELPVNRPHELVNLVSPGPRIGNQLCNDQGSCDQTFSYPLFRDLEAAGDPYIDLGASWLAQVAIGRDDDATVSGSAMLVSGGYFAALGIGPERGRLLAEHDVTDAEPNTVVLSYDYWTTAFGADPRVVGKTLRIGGRVFEIVGVTPRGFVGTNPTARPHVFAPLTLEWYQGPQLRGPITESREFSFLYVFGRLRPGVARDEAQARLDTVFRAIINDVEAVAAADDPDVRIEQFRARELHLVPGARGQSRTPEQARAPLLVFFAATGTILLIACVNLANLMFARGAARLGEIAVRASLGAGGGRLYTLLAVEALLLAGFAALLSLPVAVVVLRAIDDLQPGAIDIGGLDARAGAAAFALAVVAALLFSAAPMVKLAGIDPARVLQANGARAFGSKGIGRFRFALATTQIALSMLLLVLAALFTQSLANVARVDLGLTTESVVTFHLAPTLNGYDRQRGAQLLEAVERELAAQPGVLGVSAAAVPLLSGMSWGGQVTVEGVDAQDGARRVNFNQVGTGFFELLGIPLLAGRDFTAADTFGAPAVAIVNESFAQRFGLGAEPIGKRLAVGTGTQPDVEIVGLVADSAYDSVKSPRVPLLITPWRQSQSFGFGATFYVRTSQSPDALLAMVPRIVANVDPSVPVMNSAKFDAVVRRNVQTDWLLLTLSGVLAAIATLLAAVGIYGVLSFMVAQRTREIGLRLALGAEPVGVRRMVLKQVGWMTAIGVPAGLGGALLIGSAAASVLFGLAPTDPVAIGVAMVVLAAVVFGAGYWPARRASRVDPVVALRTE